MKKTYILIILVAFSSTYLKAQNYLNFELTKKVIPWEGANYTCGSPDFFNGRLTQLYQSSCNGSYRVIDLGEFDSLPEDPLRDITLQEQYGGSIMRHQSGEYEHIMDKKWASPKTLAVWGLEDGTASITFWEIHKDKEATLKNTIYSFNHNGDYVSIGTGQFKGFTRGGELMFSSSDDIVFVTQSGNYSSSLLNEDVSFEYTDLDVNSFWIYSLKENKYVIITSDDRLIVLDHAKTGRNIILLNQDYSSSIQIGDYSINSDDNLLTTLSNGNVYTINLLTGNFYTEITKEEIGFTPEDIRKVEGGFFVYESDYYYAFLSTEWVQSEEVHRLQLQGKGTFGKSIYDMIGNYILTEEDEWSDSTPIYELYRWSIEDTALSLETNNYKTENQVLIFPNPSSDKINITCSSTIENIIISNVQGKEVLSTKNKIININNWDPGLYFISVFTNGNKIINKFIKN